MDDLDKRIAEWQRRAERAVATADSTLLHGGPGGAEVVAEALDLLPLVIARDAERGAQVWTLSDAVGHMLDALAGVLGAQETDQADLGYDSQLWKGVRDAHREGFAAYDATAKSAAAKLRGLREEVKRLRRVETAPVVCLCGSTRFMEAFFEAGWQFTLSDIIVLSVGVCKHAGPEGHGAEAIGQDVADRLDELHKRKIDLADAVFVLDVGGYVGASTQGEINYATKLGKPLARLTEYAEGDACDIDAVDWSGASAFVQAAALAPDEGAKDGSEQLAGDPGHPDLAADDAQHHPQHGDDEP